MDSQFQIPEYMAEIVRFTSAACAPVHWQDRSRSSGSPFPGGSCFFLKFPQKIVGITANHVFAIYEDVRKKSPTLPIQISNFLLDFDASILDRDEELDIATFTVPETQLAQARIPTIDCMGSWPPPSPKNNSVLSLAGFPVSLRTVSADGRVEFRLYNALPMVDGLSDKDILITYDQGRDRAAMGVLSAPPAKFNMSGCSGGPVIMHGMRNGLHRWFPVGLIVQGPGDLSSGVFEEFDTIRIRRIDRVRDDGTIEKTSSGWLPPRTFVDTLDES